MKRQFIFTCTLFSLISYAQHTPTQKYENSTLVPEQLLKSAQNDSFNQFQKTLKLAVNSNIEPSTFEYAAVCVYLKNNQMEVEEIRRAIIQLSIQYHSYCKHKNNKKSTQNCELNIIDRLTFPCYYNERVPGCSICDGTVCPFPQHKIVFIQNHYPDTKTMRAKFLQSYEFHDTQKQIDQLNKQSNFSFSCTVFS